MKILIISLPRCGSSSLLNRIAEEKKLRPIFEPFSNRHKKPTKTYDDKIVIKTMIYHCPVEWYNEFSKEFDEIILLSRKDLKSCAESYAFLIYMERNGYIYNQEYFWKETPNYQTINSFIINWDNKLNQLSKMLNVPIIYYEDIFDINSEKRLRKGNKQLPTKLI